MIGDNIYSEQILALFEHPQHCGFIDKGDILLGKAQGIDHNEFVNIFIKLDNKKNIVDAKYQVLGCPYLIACCEVGITWLLRKRKENITTFDYNFIVDYLKLPNLKIYCAIIVSEAIYNCWQV